MGPIVSFAPLLAHQGGWDEVLLVGAPIALIIALLAVAKRRIDAQVEARADDRPDAHELLDDTPSDAGGAPG